MVLKLDHAPEPHGGLAKMCEGPTHSLLAVCLGEGLKASMCSRLQVMLKLQTGDHTLRSSVQIHHMKLLAHKY